MALTATATKKSRQIICQTLGINPVIIATSPNRPNIQYQVKLKKDTIEEQFAALVEEIKRKRSTTDRSVIFCKNYTDCGYIYLYFKNRLGAQMREPINAPDLARFRLVDMFSACHTKSFQNPEAPLTVLIATTAFGMGIDCPNIQHYGPSSNIKSYLQETGRAGRDGLVISTVKLLAACLSHQCYK